ncbi:MAG: hypothetical protein P8L37_02910 [Phycisphaerales bacterium]|nr:hypothetical protein [Phycisphaerales bacterium]
MNARYPILIALALLSTGVLGCQPVSTDGLASQENAMEVEGQSAMASENGTLGDPNTAELQPTHPHGINFADPDPFIDYDTVSQEAGIEGDETD